MKEIRRIIDGLDRFTQLNHQPAVDEPANDFETAVNEWEDLAAQVAEVKNLLKPLEALERTHRDAIAESLCAYLGADLKEGANNYELSNGRKLRFTHKMDRKVEPGMIFVARDLYREHARPGMPAFDDLLRVKYELAVAPFRKLTGEAATAVSRMVVAKPAAPTLEVD